jgi:FtsZ-interacting cell division protein ZipA
MNINQATGMNSDTITIIVMALAIIALLVPSIMRSFLRSSGEKFAFDQMRFITEQNKIEVMQLREENNRLNAMVASLQEHVSRLEAQMTILIASAEKQSAVDTTKNAVEGAKKVMRNGTRRKEGNGDGA